VHNRPWGWTGTTRMEVHDGQAMCRTSRFQRLEKEVLIIWIYN
jgi:hypothetical protein